MGADVVPESIQRDGEGKIVITWSDKWVSRWTISALRKACPCATCREKKRSQQEKQETSSGQLPMLPVLSAAETQPVQIESMQPVGSYAYNISFSDGHSSGIFPFSLLYCANDPTKA